MALSRTHEQHGQLPEQRSTGHASHARHARHASHAYDAGKFKQRYGLNGQMPKSYWVQ